MDSQEIQLYQVRCFFLLSMCRPPFMKFHRSLQGQNKGPFLNESTDADSDAGALQQDVQVRCSSMSL